MRPVMRRLLRPSAPLLLAGLLPIFAWAALTYPGYFEFHSGLLPVFNLVDLRGRFVDLAWFPGVGQPYDLLRGEGALAYRLGLVPLWLGASPAAAVKLVFGVSLLAGTVGMYAWAQRRLGGWPAAVAAALYSFAPIGLATVYVRGALAEAALLGLLPWVLWAAELTVARRRWGSVALAVALALAFWAQAGLALWLAVVVVAYLAAHPSAGGTSSSALRRPPAQDASGPESANTKHPERSGGAVSATQSKDAERPFGEGHPSTGDDSSSALRRSPAQDALIFLLPAVIFLFLAAIILLPVIPAHGLGGQTYVAFVDHLVYPHQWLLPTWGIGPSQAGPDDTLTFNLGFAAVGLALLAFLLPRRAAGTPNTAGVEASAGHPVPVGSHPHRLKPRFRRGLRNMAGVVVVVLLLLATTLAAPLWRVLPFLARTLTYPWQLALLAMPWLAWLGGAGTRRLLALLPFGERGAAAPALCAALLTLALLGAYGDLRPVPMTAPVTAAPLAVYGDDEIVLLSAVSAGRPGPNGQITLLVRWQALRPLSRDYTVFFHVIGPDGERYGQQDTIPVGGVRPTSGWRPGEIVMDQYQVALAADAPAGEYQYWLGFYRLETGERLSVNTATGSDDKYILNGTTP